MQGRLSQPFIQQSGVFPIPMTLWHWLPCCLDGQPKLSKQSSFLPFCLLSISCNTTNYTATSALSWVALSCIVKEVGTEFGTYFLLSPLLKWL
jgi:hypothetical protein